MNEKLVGFILLCAIIPLAIIGYLFIAIKGMVGSVDRRVRQSVRAVDHFVNASIFNGYAWESISSHAWRERDNKKWAKYIIKITDMMEKDHCYKANKREQPIIDLVNKKGLTDQTVGKKKKPPLI